MRGYGANQGFLGDTRETIVVEVNPGVYGTNGWPGFGANGVFGGQGEARFSGGLC